MSTLFSNPVSGAVTAVAIVTLLGAVALLALNIRDHRRRPRT